MSKNYVQKGDVITLVAPYARLSGEGALVGSIFGVSRSDVANGASGEFRVTGVFELAKTSAEAWATVGLKIYWDNATKLLTTAAAAGANVLVGVNLATAANPSPTGTVRLSGAFTI
jgi:predicted RecA/RadA family phage recombinase